MKLTVSGILLVVGVLGSHGASAQVRELASIAGAPFSGVRTEHGAGADRDQRSCQRRSLSTSSRDPEGPGPQRDGAGVKGNEKPIVLTVEQWFSPQLGLMVSKSAKATLGGEFHNEVENIDARDPDPALFTVPADYTRTEIDPKAVAAAARQAAKDAH